ncbi:hypothetical protein KJ781_02085 [Patescibacteria group bacterium]|nr:hypothetical protein [Patescibacteria group bacterium]MBU1448643.1 hypothetical protein [Patescibacteria group bacterium]
MSIDKGRTMETTVVTTSGHLLAVDLNPINPGHWGCRRHAPRERCLILRKSPVDIDYPCGHIGPRRYTLDLYGEEHYLSYEFLDEMRRCPACVFEAVMAGAIRCAACGYIILAGEQVMLYRNSGTFDPRWTTAVEDGHGVIACLRPDCRSPFFEVEGRWDGHSFIRAQETVRFHEPILPFRPEQFAA